MTQPARNTTRGDLLTRTTNHNWLPRSQPAFNDISVDVVRAEAKDAGAVVRVSAELGARCEHNIRPLAPPGQPQTRMHQRRACVTVKLDAPLILRFRMSARLWPGSDLRGCRFDPSAPRTLLE